MNKQEKDIKTVVGMLGLPRESVDFFDKPYQVAVGNLEIFKQKLKKQRRILAKKHHPDIVAALGGAASNAATEKLKNINNVIDSMLLLEIKKPQPAPTFRAHPWRFTYGFGGTAAGTSGSNFFTYTGS